MVVANDIKVEAQQELRSLRRQLQEEQERSGKLSADLEALQGVRYRAPPSFLFLLFLPLSNPPLLLAAVPRVSLHSAGVRMWSVLNLLVSQEEKTVTRVSQLSLGFFVLFIYYLFIFNDYFFFYQGFVGRGFISGLLQKLPSVYLLHSFELVPLPLLPSSHTLTHSTSTHCAHCNHLESVLVKVPIISMICADAKKKTRKKHKAS